MSSELATLRDECFAHTRKALSQAFTTDQLVIREHEMIADLHVATNHLAARLREWVGGWMPEMSDIKDHEHFIQLTSKGKDAMLKTLGREESIGTDIKQVDQAAIAHTAKTIQTLYEEKKRLRAHIEEQLRMIMPSTIAICGPQLTAELLAEAGSLKRLARLPSGTIQLLGAETALFRHLKNKKHKPPKHGVLFNHPLVQRVKREERGRAARAIADKVAITAKVDLYGGEPCGERLREAIERRFK